MNSTKIIFLWSVLFFGAYFTTNAQQREIPLTGTYNFRDLGGYKTKDNKTIKWGKIYRSAFLSELTQDDLNKLSKLRIARIADLRSPMEVKYAPDKIPSGAVYFETLAGYKIPDSIANKINAKSKTAGAEDWAAMADEMKKNSPEVSDRQVVGFYRKIVDSFKDQYKSLFDSLLTLDPDSALIFHCAGGKDRSGVAAALIEYALGVDQDQIVADYVLTNKYRKQYNKKIADMLVEKYHVPAKRAAAYGIAKPEFIEATFDEINKRFGSVDNYMEKELGLTDEKIALLRSKYVE